MAVIRAGVVVLVALSAFGCDALGQAGERLLGRRRASLPPPALPRPLPSSSASATVNRDRPALEQWARRNMIEAYSRLGKRDARWDAKVPALVEASMRKWTPSEEWDPRQVESLGREVVNLGCSDPVVLYVLGMAIADNDQDSREATVMLEQAVEGMKQVAYPRAVARYVATGLYRRFEYTNEGYGLRKMLGPVEIQWFLESLKDGSYGPDEDEILAWHLTNGSGAELFKREKERAQQALEAAPWVDEWVRALFSGIRHNYRAWDRRGHGPADQVSAEGWKGFKAETTLARQDLARAWTLRPDRHEAPHEMIAVAAEDSGAGDTPRLWFDRAVAARFDHWDSYDVLLNFMKPRWGGSYDEMLAFGKECLATGRFDTDVPLFLYSTVEIIAQDQDDEEMGGGGVPIYEDPETYALLAKMLDGYLQAPDRNWDRSYFQSIYAIVAAKSGRYPIAYEYLKAVDFSLHPNAAWSMKERTRDFVARVAARAGPAGETIEKAEAAREAVQNVKALALYREALLKDPQSDAGRFLRQRVAALVHEQALDRGQWADLSPTTSDLEGWDSQSGSFRLEKDGALLATSGQRGHLLVAEARVGPDFELTARLEFASSSNGHFQGGVVFGRPKRGSNEWISFRVKRNPTEGSVGYFTQVFHRPWVAPQATEVPDASDLLVRVMGDHLTAMVNGRVVADVTAPPGLLIDGPLTRVGVGAFHDENLSSVRYRHIRVRRLRKT